MPLTAIHIPLAALRRLAAFLGCVNVKRLRSNAAGPPSCKTPIPGCGECPPAAPQQLVIAPRGVRASLTQLKTLSWWEKPPPELKSLPAFHLHLKGMLPRQGGRLCLHVYICTHTSTMSACSARRCAPRAFVLQGDFSGYILVAFCKPSEKPFGPRSNTDRPEMSSLTDLLTKCHQGHLPG